MGTLIVNQYLDKRLLDTFPGAVAAYSLRQLSSTTTPVIRVRRSNDNAEQDFTAWDINNGTLTAWVGAGNDGFVRTWYDQSSNGNHAEQPTTTNQPRIVVSGSLVTQNGRAAIDFDSTNEMTATVTGLRSLTGYTLFGIITPSLASAADTTTQLVFGMASGGASGKSEERGSSLGGSTGALRGEHFCFFYAGNGVGRLGSSTYRHTAGEQILHTISAGTTGTVFRKNKELITIDLTYAISPSSNTSPAAGSWNSDNFHFNTINGSAGAVSQKEQEKILYSSITSTDMQLIETNINNYYNIF